MGGSCDTIKWVSSPALGEKCGGGGEFRWATSWQPLFKLIQIWDNDTGKISRLEGDMHIKKSAAVAVS